MKSSLSSNRPGRLSAIVSGLALTCAFTLPLPAAAQQKFGTQVMSVALGSTADRAGFEQGFKVTGIETERDRMAKEWQFVPALLILGLIMALQRRRARTLPVPAVAAAA